MKIKEGLVYNKYSGEIIGFTHLGDINELMKLEQGDHPPVATRTSADGKGVTLQIGVSLCSFRYL